MNGNVVVLSFTHPTECQVCAGDTRVRWCPVWRGTDGDVAARLGEPMPCLPLPVLQVPWRVDVPRGGAS